MYHWGQDGVTAGQILDGMDTNKRIHISREVRKELSEKKSPQNNKKHVRETRVRLLQIYMFQIKVYKTL